MARSKQRERFSETETSSTGRRQPLSKTSALTLTLSVLAVIWAGVMLTAQGQVTYAYTFYFLEFYAGVFTLLSLTATVVGGLLATDRIVMTIRYRVLLQTAHRMSGTAAIFFLIIHITIKVSSGAASIIDPFVPFVAATGNRAIYVGLGTIASYMMLSVFWTGIARARFAGNDKPWLWRAMHSMAYLSWPVAIGHGLSAGRTAAGWVVASYLICVLLVSIALIIRMTVGKGPRATAGSTTGSIKAIGKPVESRSFRQGANDIMAPPARGDLGGGDVLESRRGGADRGRGDDYGPPAPRREAEPSRRWGPAPDEYQDERPRRSAAEYEPERGSRYATEKVPVGDGRRRRSADETSEYAPAYPNRDRRSDDEYAPRGRGRDGDRDRDGGGRSRRSVEEYAPPRGGREDYPVSGPPRHRHEEDDQSPEAQRSRSVRRRRGASPYEPESDYEPSSYLPADDTPTLVDMAARRALRAARDSSVTPSRASRRKNPPEDTVDDRYWVS